jgi:hypothetical protein
LGVVEEPKGQVAAASFFGTSSSLRENIGINRKENRSQEHIKTSARK